MTLFNIQIQPDRSPALDERAAIQLIETLAVPGGQIAEFKRTEGDDGGRYVNFTFSVSDAITFWSQVRREVLGNREIGPAIAASSIIVCEGEQGWDDYLLLHHFDSRLELDAIE
jgi:hypothetical protein